MADEVLEYVTSYLQQLCGIFPRDPDWIPNTIKAYTNADIPPDSLDDHSMNNNRNDNQ